MTYFNLRHAGLSLLFCTLLCTCGPAQQEQQGPSIIAGTIRYQQESQLLEATLRVEPVDSSINAVSPTLLGSAMPPATLAGPGRYQTRRTLPFPVDIRLTAPCPTGTNCPINYSFQPPFSDSIPANLQLGASARFPVGTEGLKENESLVIFFEPADRSAPRRIQLLGPTSDGTLTLRKEVFSDIPAGQYEVYLVKQQLQKDSSATLVSSIQTEYFSKAKSVEILE